MHNKNILRKSVIKLVKVYQKECFVGISFQDLGKCFISNGREVYILQTFLVVVVIVVVVVVIIIIIIVIVIVVVIIFLLHHYLWANCLGVGCVSQPKHTKGFLYSLASNTFLRILAVPKMADFWIVSVKFGLVYVYSQCIMKVLSVQIWVHYDWNRVRVSRPKCNFFAFLVMLRQGSMFVAWENVKSKLQVENLEILEKSLIHSLVSLPHCTI